MTTKSLSFQAPLSLAIAEGATTPDPGVTGVIVWSTVLGVHVAWTGTKWTASFFGGPASGVFQENNTNLTVDYTINSGKNASTVGPLTINTGKTLTIPSGQRIVIL